MKTSVTRLRALLVGMLLLLGAGLAFGAGNLVVYNAGTPEMGDDLVKAFKAKYPDVKVDVIRAGSGELITRMQAEAKKPQGDVIVAIAKENLEVIADLLFAYKVKEDAAFPAGVKDPNGLFYGFSYNIQAFIVNTELVTAADMPKSWKDLGDKKWSGKILLANPALSGSSYAQLFQMVGLYGWDHINAVRRVATYVPTSTLAYTLVSRGEFAIGVTGEGNVFTEKSKGMPVVAVYPSEGTGLRFDASGIIKGGPNLANAKLWMDWLTTKEAMGIVSQSPHFRRMVRPDVAPPPGLPPSSEIKFFAYDDAAATANRDAYLKKFGEIFATQ
ncbi:MAG: extracellular solute-binding protein [Spirochaetes bacterium]|nr:extracellular solute-binding protein [Spirochaetota bacterium]